MNRWKWSTSWALVWSVFITMGSMIIYTGYSDAVYSTSQERTPMISNEPDQAQSELTVHEPEIRVTALTRQAKTGKMTEDNLTLKDFPCPVQGIPLRSVGNYYSEVFDSYLFHAGIDYREPEGTMIRATHGGKVIFSGGDQILGQKVTLDCGEGWIVTYGGLDNLRVQVGETIETLDALGQVGFYTAPEGESDQPQLHYEVWYRDEVQGLR